MMSIDIPCPGFSKIVKTQSRELLLVCSLIDKCIDLYPYEAYDVSDYLARLKVAIEILKKYAELLETENIPIRCTLRPVEWDFRPWFIEKINLTHSAEQKLNEYFKSPRSFLILDLISLCFGDIEQFARGIAELSDSLRVQIVHEDISEKCEHATEKQNTKNGSVDLTLRQNKQ